MVRFVEFFLSGGPVKARGNWNFHSHILSLPRANVPLGGTFAPWNSRSLELSLSGTFASWNFLSQERKWCGTFALFIGLRGYKGARERAPRNHPSICDWNISLYALVLILFAPRNVTSGASRGPQKKFSRFAIARHILQPLINYYHSRPLLPLVQVLMLRVKSS